MAEYFLRSSSNMSDIHDPNHPIWKILLHGTYLGAALASLWIYSSNFDATELKTRATIAVSVCGTETAKKLIVNRSGTEE